MSRQRMKIDTDKYATYRAGPDADRGPLVAALVGGNPGHGNVNKLPRLLWAEFGIAVITHWRQLSDVDRDVDLAVILTDQCSSDLQRRASSKSKTSIRAPSSWTRVVQALTQANVQPVPGNQMVRPSLTPRPATQAERDQAYALFQEGRSVGFIAGKLNRPRGTVSSWVYRMRQEERVGEEAASMPEPAAKAPVAQDVAEPATTPEVRHIDDLEVATFVAVDEIRDELTALVARLDTPEVRVVSGAAPSLSDVVAAVIRRGIAAIQSDLGEAGD